MDYKTHGVCSSMIHVELDGDKIKDVDFAGNLKPCKGNESGRRHRKTFRNQMRFQSNFLPGSACQSTPRSNRSVN